MSEERRSAPRARISGARIIYESAAGDHVETDAVNIGRGGLFVRATKPLAVGKRVTLEIQIAGEPTPWSALGRVIWMRAEADGAQMPSGMGIKLIDVEDSMLEAIDRLVQLNETPKQAEVARAAAEAVKREPTMLGVGSTSESAIATPIVSVVPARERTVLGIGIGSSSAQPATVPDPFPPAKTSSPPVQPAPGREPSGTPEPSAARELGGEREPSVVIDLVDSEKPPPARRAQAVDEVPTVIRRRRRGRWTLVFALLLLAAAAAYVLLGADPDRLQRLMGSSPSPTPSPSPSPSATASPPAAATPSVVAWPNASAAVSPVVSTPPGTHLAGSASAPQTGHGTAASTSTSPSATSARTSTSGSGAGQESFEPKKASSPSGSQTGHSKKPPATEDNPY